jgi:hypothetical protein
MIAGSFGAYLVISARDHETHPGVLAGGRAGLASGADTFDQALQRNCMQFSQVTSCQRPAKLHTVLPWTESE